MAEEEDGWAAERLAFVEGVWRAACWSEVGKPFEAASQLDKSLRQPWP